MTLQMQHWSAHQHCHTGCLPVLRCPPSSPRQVPLPLIPSPSRLLRKSLLYLHTEGGKPWPSRRSLKLYLFSIEAGVYSNLLEPVPYCLINILNTIFPIPIITIALIVLYYNYSCTSWLPSPILKHLRTEDQSDSSLRPSVLENDIILIDVW